MRHPLQPVLLLIAILLLCACGAARAGSGEAGAGPVTQGGTSLDADGGTEVDSSPGAGPGPVVGGSGPDASPSSSSPPAGDAGPIVPSPASSGTIAFHLLLGVEGSSAGDAITLTGDGYTDLIMSNFVAGAMYGHLVASYTPGMLFARDYLFGSIFGQLLQENLATEDYVASSGLIDSSPDQQAVMAEGQGGPYQINNYAADMVYGTYAPQGYALVNYVALQKNIGFSFADAATQYAKATPAPFNDKYFGPMLTAYFHFNDYVALQEIGPLGDYTPEWEPAYDDALTTFKSLPENFLDVVLNVAYNQGYYGPLLTSYSKLGATATAQTVATVDAYSAIWGINDTYEQYPYQVRYYLDQLYDNPIPTTSPAATTTPANHVRFAMSALGTVFGSVFSQIAYNDPQAGYVDIATNDANAAFASALAAAGVTASSALDLSDGADRSRIFDVLEGAIATLEANLGASFIARSTTAL